jgi:phosphoribosyl-AMP cyclohydrolase
VTAVDPASELFDAIRWNSDGLVPTIAQDAETGEVLMMAWMDREALRLTLSNGQSHFHSRSRGETWHKGGTSGHIQTVEEIRVDCDGDTLLLRVRQVGGACHEGYRTCFFRRVDAGQRLETVEPRVFDPATVYREPTKHT